MAVGDSEATPPPVQLRERQEVVEERSRVRRVEPVILVGGAAVAIASHRQRHHDRRFARPGTEKVRPTGVPEARPAVSSRRIHGEEHPRLSQREQVLHCELAPRLASQRRWPLGLVIPDGSVAHRREAGRLLVDAVKKTLRWKLTVLRHRDRFVEQEHRNV